MRKREPSAAAPATRDEIQLVRRHLVPRGAAQLDGDGLAALAMAQLNRATMLVEPLVAPVHQGDERREQVGALVGQAVALAGALAGLAVVLALEQAVVDELAQARRGDGVADPDPLGEVVEAGRAVERLTEDEERRA